MKAKYIFKGVLFSLIASSSHVAFSQTDAELKQTAVAVLLNEDPNLSLKDPGTTLKIDNRKNDLAVIFNTFLTADGKARFVLTPETDNQKLLLVTNSHITDKVEALLQTRGETTSRGPKTLLTLDSNGIGDQGIDHLFTKYHAWTLLKLGEGAYFTSFFTLIDFNVAYNEFSGTRSILSVGTVDRGISVDMQLNITRAQTANTVRYSLIVDWGDCENGCTEESIFNFEMTYSASGQPLSASKISETGATLEPSLKAKLFAR